MLVNPIYLSNKTGVPRVLTSAVTVTSTSVKYTVPSNAMFGNYYNGLMLLKVNQAIPDGTTTTLPVYLSSTNGGDQLVTIANGATLTAADVTTGIHLAYYESNTSTLQIIA